jgi:glycosyltransferase involved in cell wall biosynthesis
MKNRSLVSVVVPTYNRAGIISKTIDDVLSQTYQDMEVIVIDDGSTDDTQQVLRNYGNRIRVITQPNGGAAAARNRGIEASRGAVIAFQDSDDLWNPEKLSRQVALLGKVDKSVPCCLCNALMQNLYGDGKDHFSFDLAEMHPRYREGLWLNVTEVLANRFVLFNQTVAIRRDALEKTGGYDTTLKYLDDVDLPLRLSLEGPWAYIRDPLTIWAGGTSDSLARRDAADEIGFKQCELKVFARALEAVKARGGNRSLRTSLERRLKVYRAGLRQIHLRNSSSFAKRTLGKIDSLFERYYGAAFRRSPWFPKMKAVPVEESTNAR